MREGKQTLNAQRPTPNAQLRAHAAAMLLFGRPLTPSSQGVEIATTRFGSPNYHLPVNPHSEPSFLSELSAGRWALGVGRLPLSE